MGARRPGRHQGRPLPLGLSGARRHWLPALQHLAGPLSDENTAADGYQGTAPAGAFAPNGYGLFNMAGNVWEWCADLFKVRSISKKAKARNEAAVASDDRVAKGGSHMCHQSYCYRYRIAARNGISCDSSTGHTGFRIVFDVAG